MASITGKSPAEKDEVLLDNGPVEPKLRAQRRQGFLGRVIAQDVGRGIAGYGPHQEEGHRDDPEHRDGKLEQSATQEANHVTSTLE